ncbi:MAG: sigma 54-interacting transcriptional regulator, partial [Myxococcota bacterium]|nr:sigma 54-interacting transcriptional regulator [Myxococcota bacterium]
DELGFVRAAEGGTLFLDEIADLPRASQAAILRVLQEREVVPVGAVRPIKVDVRLIAATHNKLADLVARGKFRRDLFARLAGFVVSLPPLKERRDDFGVITAAVLPKIGGDSTNMIAFAPDAGRALLMHDWPLNIRELKHCLATSVALARGRIVERSHLPPHVSQALDKPAREPSVHPPSLNARDEQLRLALLEQMSRHSGNIASVAQAMGKARMQVHRWCRRFGVNPDVFRR